YLHCLDEQQSVQRTAGPGPRPPTVPADCPYGKKVHQAHGEFLDVKQSEAEALTYKHYVDKLLPFYERFATRPVASLTEADGLGYQTWLMNEKEWKKGKKQMKGLGPCSVNHHLRAARTFLSWCARPARRYIPFNPWSGLNYLKEHGRE